MIPLYGDALFWVCDKVAQDAYDVEWHPGQEFLADYQSNIMLDLIIKLFVPGIYTRRIYPWYYPGQPDLAL
jgi:hypothetical protein